MHFNWEMSRVRQAVEWGFGGIVNHWGFIDFKKNLKVLGQQLAKQ
jgi:hypothetical protein